jgi:hypothetical protein
MAMRCTRSHPVASPGRSDRLRELVERGVGDVPVIRQKPDAQASVRTRALVKRYVRRTALAAAGSTVPAVAVCGLIAYR